MLTEESVAEGLGSVQKTPILRQGESCGRYTWNSPENLMRWRTWGQPRPAKLKGVGGFRRVLRHPLSDVSEYQNHSRRGRKGLAFVPSLLAG